MLKLKKISLVFLTIFSLQTYAMAAVTQYSSEHGAGPLFSDDAGDECVPSNPGDGYNVYDYAKGYAYQDAISKCKIDGATSCTYLTEVNEGYLQGQGMSPGHGNCWVEVYVTGEK